jgi:hypothetical protein
MEERFGMAQFSHLLGHTELNWRDEIRPSYADPGGGQAFGQAGSRLQRVSQLLALGEKQTSGLPTAQRRFLGGGAISS